jgi:hypothetical protein
MRYNKAEKLMKDIRSMDFAFLGLIALSVLPSVLVGVIIVFVVRQYKHEKALGDHLNSQGTVVTGQIVKHRVQEMKRGCRCYLTYRYVFEGIEHEYEQFVNVEGFNSVRDGEAVKVLFLPEDSSTPRLAPIDQFRLRL